MSLSEFTRACGTGFVVPASARSWAGLSPANEEDSHIH